MICVPTLPRRTVFREIASVTQLRRAGLGMSWDHIVHFSYETWLKCCRRLCLSVCARLRTWVQVWMRCLWSVFRERERERVRERERERERKREKERERKKERVCVYAFLLLCLWMCADVCWNKLASQMDHCVFLCVCVCLCGGWGSDGQWNQVVIIAWLLSISYAASAPGSIISLLPQLSQLLSTRISTALSVPHFHGLRSAWWDLWSCSTSTIILSFCTTPQTQRR